VAVIARRTRRYPTDFVRASTFVKTIDRPEIEDPARRLLTAMRYTGLIEIEVKRDARDSRYTLLDMNLRVEGWQSLGRRVGADVPCLLWRVLAGGQIPEVRARSGVRWVQVAIGPLLGRCATPRPSPRQTPNGTALLDHARAASIAASPLPAGWKRTAAGDDHR